MEGGEKENICQPLKKRKKGGLLFVNNLDYGFAPAQLCGSALPLPAVHVSTLAGGVSQVFGWPPPFVQVSFFSAEAVLPNEGASATARTAATPIARNIAFLFITFYRTEY
ncbi:MAG TPA: hypothetical protein VKA95_04125 [Nitrososphaeraceae archaeon]|nr:hypothetical protein [Nitrososphaeraceae archaeon]